MRQSISNKTNEVNSFCNLIYFNHDDPHVALCLIPPDGKGVEHRFTKISNLSRFLPYARFRNASGWNVYITPSVLRPDAQNRRKKSFLDQQSIIYLDCDDRSSLDEIKDRYPYPTLVVKTSLSRYQVYWRLLQPVDREAQENLMCVIARDVGADIAATDVSRVLRLPSFWNRKPDRKPCTVDIVFQRDHAVSYKSLSQCCAIAVSDLIPGQAQGDDRACSQPVLGSEGNSKRMPDYSTSGIDWYLTNRWIGVGELVEDIIERLIARRSDKPDPRRYAHHTVKKALRLKGDPRWREVK